MHGPLPAGSLLATGFNDRSYLPHSVLSCSALALHRYWFLTDVYPAASGRIVIRTPRWLNRFCLQHGIGRVPVQVRVLLWSPVLVGAWLVGLPRDGCGCAAACRLWMEAESTAAARQGTSCSNLHGSSSHGGSFLTAHTCPSSTTTTCRLPTLPTPAMHGSERSRAAAAAWQTKAGASRLIPVRCLPMVLSDPKPHCKKSLGAPEVLTARACESRYMGRGKRGKSYRGGASAEHTCASQYCERGPADHARFKRYSKRKQAGIEYSADGIHKEVRIKVQRVWSVQGRSGFNNKSVGRKKQQHEKGK